MKKLYLLLLLCSILALLMVACGTPEQAQNPSPTTEPTSAPTATMAPQETLTPKPTATNTPTPKPTVTPKPTATPTPATTPTPSPTPAPSLEVLWEMRYENGELPTDRAWIDELYSDLVNGNYLDVVELLKDNSIFEKVKPYLYYEYVYDSSAYRLVTSDDKILGIHLPNDPNDTSDRHAWYSEWEDYGFWDTEYGDKEVVYSNADYYDWNYIWFDGEKATYSNGDVRYYEEYQCVSIWEF